MQTDQPFDQTTISLQMGTRKGGNQAGMLAPGTRRDIYHQELTLQPMDNSTISLRMGTNKVASQKGVSVCVGLGGERMIPNPALLPQNLPFTMEAEEQEPVGRKSVTVIIRQNTQMSITASTKMTAQR